MSQTAYANPVPTVDVIIEYEGGIVLIERRNPPHGWALPGGFVDQGEPLWQAAVREAREETSLHVELLEQFHSYSDPRRDGRRHTIATVFLGRGHGRLEAGDDAGRAAVFYEHNVPALAFDHSDILHDYFRYRRDGTRPGPER